MTELTETAAERPLFLLASQSPRRRRLLAWLGAPFETTAVETPEDLADPRATDPESLAAHLASDKALAARAQGLARDLPVLAFDTVVVHEGHVLGKPTNVEEAWRMLRSLSGAMHQVVTGCAVLSPGDASPVTFSVTTDVTMRDLSDGQIEEWMAEGTFMGCAGAYNIESQVAEVTLDECFQNVAGLPLCHLFAALNGAEGFDCLRGRLRSPADACDAALKRRCKLADAVGGRRL